jgi:microsomal dipeptidase-like Zn-dependent dipeptidase
MIVDLHAHYPMHLDPGLRGNVLALLRTRRGELRLRDWVRALGVNLASQFANYPSLFSGPRVRVPWMAQGGVGVALSVLYSFFDEAERTPPSSEEYVDELLRQAHLVRKSVEGTAATVARSPADLAPAPGKVILVHCVEGGFHLLGGDVGDAVDRLADAGVAYITLAHLVYRGVATGANAFPFLSDAQYARHCRQPAEVGLTAKGRAAVEAMVRRRVLVDVSHMSERALVDTFELLDELDPGKTVPVLATHGAYRLGTQSYNLTRPTVERIAERDGVIGLILARHQVADGVPKPARGLEGTVDLLCRHIEAIAAVTGDHRHVAIGSDFDGFVKPTLDGLRDMRDMAELERRLVDRLGPGPAQLVCSENALRPLRAYWRGAAVSARAT